MRRVLLLAGVATCAVAVTAQIEPDTTSSNETLAGQFDEANLTFPDTFNSNYTFAYCAYPVSVGYTLTACKTRQLIKIHLPRGVMASSPDCCTIAPWSSPSWPTITSGSSRVLWPRP